MSMNPKHFLNSCKEFNLKDTIGHRMYSVALSIFIDMHTVISQVRSRGY